MEWIVIKGHVVSPAQDIIVYVTMERRSMECPVQDQVMIMLFT